jgi:peptidoglycan/LPS O-acetylase OafA/YrhL
MSNETAGAGRLTSVDALRGLAALGVVLAHVPHPPVVPGHGTSWLFLPAVFGKHGVALFLVISGLCIHLGAARALARGQGARCDWGAFWKRRFRRLYPPYLAAVLLTLLIALALFPNYGPLWTSYQAGAVSPAGDVLTHLLMVHNLFWNYAAGLGNPPFWTLGLEEQLYALYAVLLLLRARLSAGRTFAAVAAVTLLWYAAWVVLQHGLGRPWVCWHTWPFSYWLVWGLGALAAEAYTGALTLPRWCYRPGVGLALVAAGLLLEPPVPLLLYVDSGLAGALGPGHWLGRVAAVYFPLHLPSVYLVSLGGFVLLNRWLRAEAGGRFRGRAAAGLAWVGYLSYSLYLTHLPLLALCDVALRPLGLPLNILTTLARYALLVPACVAGAWVFFVLVERHFLNHPRQAPAAPRLRRAA